MDDLLRACYEAVEPRLAGPHDDPAPHPVTWDDLQRARNWSAARLQWLLRQALSQGLLRRDAHDRFHLTAAGRAAALRAVRNHRLWELYLIHFAEVPPSHVDRSADTIEHVLQPEVIEELEDLWRESATGSRLPQNPHAGVSPGG
jgi:manganese/zinc/iron transport system permease protein